ncbi:hypothetical protein LINGRAHAP2_LOCUS28820 [Linum grandiflorum]
MAIKGNNSSSSGGGNRGRPYGVMLLIAFGAALLGVLVVHKLRERRIFNILVTEKEQQLYSLHLLLQKEREESNEMRKKAEEMKTKLDALRTQKMELDRKVLEMQSSIDSLKDEGKALENAVEEKQNEIKTLREASTATSVHDDENARVAALTESVKQKEAEIQELKRKLEDPVKVWSVGSDDPSNGVNSNGTKVADSVGVKGKEIEGQNDESRVVNSTNGEGLSGKLPEGENVRGTDRRRLSRDKELLAAEVNNKELLAAQVNNITGVDKDIINTDKTQEDSVGIIRGGMRMEMKDEVESTGKRKHVHSRKGRGKKLRMLARKRWLGNNMSHENDEQEAQAKTSTATSSSSDGNWKSPAVHGVDLVQRRSSDHVGDQQVEIAEKHKQEGRNFELEKGVEDLDLMYQEAESNSASDSSPSRNT